MRTVCRRHWNRRAYNGTSYQKNQSSVQVHQKSRIKTDHQKCHFGVLQVEFLGRTITPDGIAPQDQKIKNFLAKVRFPKSKKQVQKHLGFVNYYQNYVPRLSEKLIGIYELLKADSKIRISEELVDIFKEVNTSLAEACGLALRQPIEGKQYVLMTERVSAHQVTPS